MGTDIQEVIKSSARLTALKKTNLLDTPPEEAFDRLTRLASMIIGAPTSLVSLVDAERQFFKSAVGLNEELTSQRETPLSYSFCAHAVHSGEDLIIEDARTHPLVKESPSIDEYGTISYAGIPLINEEGHAFGTFCVIDTEPRQWTAKEIEVLRELASLVMTEIRLRSTVIGLREIDRMREELIAVISHDLRNPLTAILGSSSLLMRQGNSMKEEDKINFLTTIHRQGERMLKMTEEMLARSKANAHEDPMSEAPVDLTEVLARVIATFRASECPNAFEVEAPSSAVVMGDEGMLEQVVTNLVDNARKYSPEGSVIQVRIEDRDGHVVLEVIDSGIGIDEELLSGVFQPFQQVDEGKDISMGVGLGLHIVRKFVEMHGGSVKVDSRKGEGSKFSVTLPSGNA